MGASLVATAKRCCAWILHARVGRACNVTYIGKSWILEAAISSVQCSADLACRVPYSDSPGGHLSFLRPWGEPVVIGEDWAYCSVPLGCGIIIISP